MTRPTPADRTSTTRWVVDFPLGGNDSIRIPQVEIRQQQGSHDLALVTVPGKLMAVEKTFTTGAPVKISWSNRWGRNQFVGYVHHVRAHYGSDKFLTNIVCVGASFPLTGIRQRSFSNTTADAVVRQIAAENGLYAVTEPHYRVYESIPQPTISDWALLCRLAKETGYVLRADQTRIMFVSRPSLDNQNRPMAQVFTQQTAEFQSVRQMSQIFEFEPILGDYLPEIGISNTQKSARSVNPYTGDSVVLESDNRINRETGIFPRPLDLVAKSVQDARARLEATVEAARFIHRARTTTVGSPSVSPEKVVFFAGLPRPYSGYWTVLSVTHRLRNTSNYVMEMEVGSEEIGPQPALPGSDLSPDANDLIVARDLSGQNIIAGMNAESVLDVVPGDVEQVIGRAFERAVWKSKMLTEV